MADNFVGDYSNVSLYCVFTKLYHQITLYLIGWGGTICVTGAGAATAAKAQTNYYKVKLDVFI